MNLSSSSFMPSAYKEIHDFLCHQTIIYKEDSKPMFKLHFIKKKEKKKLAFIKPWLHAQSLYIQHLIYFSR